MTHVWRVTHVWREAARGGLAVLPLALANIPFAIAYALGAAAAGLAPFEAVGLSVLVFAGSAQFVSVGLIGAGAGPLALAGAVLLVNLRHLLLGAALAPELRSVSAAGRAALAFGLTDEAFAVSVRPLAQGTGPAFLVGAEVALFLVWQPSVAAAAYFGAALAFPGWVPLDLVLPLTMLALLVAVARGGRDVVVALAAALVATGMALAGAGAWATLAGIAVGGAMGGVLPGEPDAVRAERAEGAAEPDAVRAERGERSAEAAGPRAERRESETSGAPEETGA